MWQALTFSCKSKTLDWRRGTRQVVSSLVTVAAGRSLRVGFSSTFLPQDTFRTAQLSAKFIAITARTTLVERPEHGRISLSVVLELFYLLLLLFFLNLRLLAIPSEHLNFWQSICSKCWDRSTSLADGVTWGTVLFELHASVFYNKRRSHFLLTTWQWRSTKTWDNMLFVWRVSLETRIFANKHSRKWTSISRLWEAPSPMDILKISCRLCAAQLGQTLLNYASLSSHIRVIDFEQITTSYYWINTATRLKS